MQIFLILLTILILFGALRAAVGLASSATVSHPPEARAGKLRLADCPDKPNCQGSESSRKQQQVAPFQHTGDTSAVMLNLAEMLDEQPGVAIISRTDNYLHATFTTRIMGYIDDVEFLLDELPGHIQVRSASRLGRSDLGANKKRIDKLRRLSSQRL